MPAKKSSAIKAVQRLDFVIEKVQLQNLLREDKGEPNIKINFGIDYEQKIWVSASSYNSNENERPATFAQKLVFSMPKKSIVAVLKTVRQGGSVKISMVIADDQKIWVTLSPKKGDQTTLQPIKQKTASA